MKIRIVLLSFSFFLIASVSFAQKEKPAKSIIRTKTGIKKYHNKEELDQMHKGELLVLYVERIESLVKILPYIAFATKPGITMTTLGIPNDSDNRKSLDDQFEATDEFLTTTEEFQKRILPYSDTGNLSAAILFYEDIFKSIHQFGEFN